MKRAEVYDGICGGVREREREERERERLEKSSFISLNSQQM